MMDVHVVWTLLYLHTYFQLKYGPNRHILFTYMKCREIVCVEGASDSKLAIGRITSKTVFLLYTWYTWYSTESMGNLCFESNLKIVFEAKRKYMLTHYLRWFSTGLSIIRMILNWFEHMEFFSYMLTLYVNFLMNV